MTTAEEEHQGIEFKRRCRSGAIEAGMLHGKRTRTYDEMLIPTVGGLFYYEASDGRFWLERFTSAFTNT